MKKCFISQKMAGLSDFEILANRNKIIDHVKNLVGEFEFIDTNISEDFPSGVNPGIWYLGKSIELLSTAALFVVSNNDLSSRGCAFEFDVAKSYGIDILIV